MTNATRYAPNKRRSFTAMRWRWVAPIALLALGGCSGLSKIDYTTFGRGSWQRPDKVVAALELREGDRVADLGAGEGYFIPYLADAVGANGRVYAVDIDPERIVELEERFAEGNVEVVRAAEDDPKLPAGTLDVVLIVNTYHHIDARPRYFARLRGNLRRGGRVVVIEPNADLEGILRLFLEEGHTSHARDVAREMKEAGYRQTQSLDFLPVQNLGIFSPADE